MLAQGLPHVFVELFETSPQHGDVFAEVGRLRRVSRPRVPPHQRFRVRDERRREGLTDFSPPVVDDACDLLYRLLGELRRRGPAPDDGRRELAAKVVDVPRQLGKTEVDDAMKLPYLVAHLLRAAVSELDELAQLERRLVGQAGRKWLLLRSEASQLHRVDGVRLGSRELLLREAARTQRIDEREDEPALGQPEKEVLPVVSRRLHHDERVVGGAAQQRSELVVSLPIFGERRGLHEGRSLAVDHGDHVFLRTDVDAYCSHDAPPTRGDRVSGASEPTFQLMLVHTRRRGLPVPQDTVRARNVGRGRQSHSRGLRPMHRTATLSRTLLLASSLAARIA